MESPTLLAIDLGAGQGTRCALYTASYHETAQGVFPVHSYGGRYERYQAGLQSCIQGLLKDAGLTLGDIGGIGIASAGIQDHDGTFLLTANIPFLSGCNLAADLGDALGIPTLITNDGDAGALGEWSVLRREMLYWVLGGGWGGAWVSAEGSIRFPSTGWKGGDRLLHPSNEPGYCLPVAKSVLREIFGVHGADYDSFEAILVKDLGPGGILGPDRSPADLRAEALVSGPGRVRLFQALGPDATEVEDMLGTDSSHEIADTALGGRHISALARRGHPLALRCDTIFGTVLGYCAVAILTRAMEEGLPEDCPVALGGKPALALPWFGPAAQAVIGAAGLGNYLRPSVMAEAGLNANLTGAAVLAAKAALRR